MPSHPAPRARPSALLPGCSQGLGSPAGRRSSPAPPRPTPPLPSLPEPRWRLAESITSPCLSCCPWPLCCYLCCSPAPSPYVSVRTPGAAVQLPGDLGGLTFISRIWKYLQGSGEWKVENAAGSFRSLTATPQLLSFEHFLVVFGFV